MVSLHLVNLSCSRERRKESKHAEGGHVARQGLPLCVGHKGMEENPPTGLCETIRTSALFPWALTSNIAFAVLLKNSAVDWRQVRIDRLASFERRKRTWILDGLDDCSMVEPLGVLCLNMLFPLSRLPVWPGQVSIDAKTSSSRLWANNHPRPAWLSAARPSPSHHPSPGR